MDNGSTDQINNSSIIKTKVLTGGTPSGMIHRNQRHLNPLGSTTTTEPEEISNHPEEIDNQPQEINGQV